MKKTFREIFSAPSHLGVTWMIIIVLLFLLDMLFNIHIFPTWVWLICIIPGFSMIIAEREPESMIGAFGLYIYNKINIYGYNSHKNNSKAIKQDEQPEEVSPEDNSNWDNELLENDINIKDENKKT